VKISWKRRENSFPLLIIGFWQEKKLKLHSVGESHTWMKLLVLDLHNNEILMQVTFENYL
jgi:hypothetical protein